MTTCSLDVFVDFFLEVDPFSSDGCHTTNKYRSGLRALGKIPPGLLPGTGHSATKVYEAAGDPLVREGVLPTSRVRGNWNSRL